MATEIDTALVVISGAFLVYLTALTVIDLRNYRRGGREGWLGRDTPWHEEPLVVLGALSWILLGVRQDGTYLVVIGLVMLASFLLRYAVKGVCWVLLRIHLYRYH